MPASSDPTSFSYGTPAGPDTGDLTGATSTNSLGGIFNSGSTSALQTLSIVVTNILSDNKKIAFEPYNVQYTLSDGTTGYSALHYATKVETEGLNGLGNVVITGTPSDNQPLAYNNATSKWINQKLAFDGIDPEAVIIESEGISSNDNDTTLPTSAAVKDYVDTHVTAQDLDFEGDTGGTLSIELQSEVLDIAGGTGIATAGANNTLTVNIDDTVVTKVGEQTLTNKTLTTPIIASLKQSGSYTLTMPAATDTLVGKATTDTLTNKTLTSPVITTPQINDTSANHQYIVAVSELAADRTITLPLLAGNDEITFNAHTQTLTNKTLTTPVIASLQQASGSNTLTMPATTDTLVGRATTDTLTNKTLTSPVLDTEISGTAFQDDDAFSSASASKVASSESIKAYVDSVASGLDVKDSVVVATTANITLANTQTIDGVSLSAGDRVLVKDQSTGADNGIYVVVSGGSWTRATDFDSNTEVTDGTFFFVEQGTTQADSGWVLTTNNPITVGTTALVFSQFSGAGQITAGDGLTKSGNTINVVGTADKITVNANDITIASTYTGQNTITTTGALNAGSITSDFGAIDNGTSGIRTNTFTAEDSILPSAVGGADLGSTSAEWGDIYIADDKAIKFGNGQDATIEYDEDGTDTLLIKGAAVNFGVDDTGIDVKFFGATSGKYMEWDESADQLNVSGNVTISGNNQLQFGDNDTYIHQSADGVLDLVSDTEIEINASTIDINGAVEMDSTLGVTGATTLSSTVRSVGNFDVNTNKFTVNATSGNTAVAGTLGVTGVTTLTATPIANAGISVKNGSTSAGYIEFFEDSDNGTNKATLIGPSSTADVTLTLPSTTGTVALTSDLSSYAPLAGATFTGDVAFGDSIWAKFGASDDLKIGHHANQSYIENYVGHLNIWQLADAKDINLYSDDGTGGTVKYIMLDGGEGEVKLYHAASGSSSVKLTTKSTGVTVTGTAVTDGLTVGDNTDATTILGRAKIASPTTDIAYFSHYDFMDADSYALAQTSAGITAINAHTGQTINLNVNNTNVAQVTSTGLTVKADTDATTTLGRALIHSPSSDIAVFSHVDKTASTDYALRQDANGATYLNSPSGGIINFNINNSNVASIDSSGLTTSKLTTSGDIELGHANDTTISRVSEGVISVQDKTIATVDDATALAIALG